MNATMFMPPHDVNIPKEKFGQVIDSKMYIKEQLMVIQNLRCP